MKFVVLLFVLAAAVAVTTEQETGERNYYPQLFYPSGPCGSYSYHCRPYGQCVMKKKKPKCKCYSGYSGPYCKKKKCPKKKPHVYCFVNPCKYATCKNHPHARCVPNYCGGCNADFYVDSKEVKCKKTKKKKMCPPPGSVNPVPNDCNKNSDCPGKKWCCPDACSGHSCVMPIPKP